MADTTEPDRPEPVEGVVFPSSTRKALGFVAGGFLLTGVALLVVGWRLDWWQLLADRRPTLFITIAAGFVGILGPFLVIHSILQMLRKRRLVIGTDRLQLVQTSGGEDVVVAQVMYANISGLVPTKTEAGKQLNVKLEDRNAAGTFDTVNVIRPTPNKAGHDLVIEDHFEGKLEDLVNALEEAVMDWRAKNDPD